MNIILIQGIYQKITNFYIQFSNILPKVTIIYNSSISIYIQLTNIYLKITTITDKQLKP